ncbi:MAG: hypothetical protein AAF152_06905 [Cyanobacteria bacterium P01_A01_bin.114]
MKRFVAMASTVLVSVALSPACSTPEPAAEDPPIEGALVRGVNFNGAGGIEIDGYRWTSQDDSKANGMMLREVEAIATELTPKPGVDEETEAMLNSAIAKPGKLEIDQILYGAQYELYLWFMETERGTQRTMSVEIEGQTVEDAMGGLAFKQWARYGPYPFEVSDGEINIAITPDDPEQKAQVMGMLIVKPDNSGSL